MRLGLLIASVVSMIAIQSIGRIALAQNGAHQATLRHDAFVRSGPGDDFYSTERLQAGESVTVHHVDEQGWCAIQPTAESFSWISAADLESGGKGVWKVTAPRTRVFVGSQLSDARSESQGDLLQGDVVHLYGREDLTHRRWCQIVPPVGEFRWIHQQHLSPRSLQASHSTVSNSRIDQASWQGNTHPTNQAARAGDSQTLQYEEPISNYRRRGAVSQANPDAGNIRLVQGLSNAAATSSSAFSSFSQFGGMASTSRFSSGSDFNSISLSSTPAMIGDLFGGSGSLATVQTSTPAVYAQDPTVMGPAPGVLVRVNSLNQIQLSNFMVSLNNAGTGTVSGDGFAYGQLDNGQLVPFTAPPTEATEGTAFFGTAVVAQVQLGNITNITINSPNVIRSENITAIPTTSLNQSESVTFASDDGAMRTLPLPGGFTLLGYVVTEDFQIIIPDPGSGGVVGRQKIAENGSPLPRDRIFFDYSYFNNTPLAAGGADVNRYTLGVEQAFFQGWSSLEFRLPFASTVDSTMVVGSAAGREDAALGNLQATLKSLVSYNGVSASAIGIGVSIPTEDDVVVRGMFGEDIVRVENESIHLLPFVGGIYKPTERTFMQGFLQVDVPVSGNPVFVKQGRDENLTQIGEVTDATYLFADVNVGYHSYVNPDPNGWLKTVTPMLEAHYNQSLTSSTPVSSGAFQIGRDADNIQILNAVAGLQLAFQPNTTFTTSFTTPIGNGSDQQYDWEVRAFLNWYFGPRANSSPASVFSEGDTYFD